MHAVGVVFEVQRVVADVGRVDFDEHEQQGHQNAADGNYSQRQALANERYERLQQRMPLAELTSASSSKLSE
ncbi:MAG: hypothetical protein ABI231_02330 [Candidatus Tumulicola sp.]